MDGAVVTSAVALAELSTVQWQYPSNARLISITGGRVSLRSEDSQIKSNLSWKSVAEAIISFENELTAQMVCSSGIKPRKQIDIQAGRMLVQSKHSLSKNDSENQSSPEIAIANDNDTETDLMEHILRKHSNTQMTNELRWKRLSNTATPYAKKPPPPAPPVNAHQLDGIRGNGIEPGIISAWDADGTEIFKISSSLKERIMAYLPFDVQQELNESRLDLEREEREERAGAPEFRRRSSTLNPQSNRMKNKTKSCSDLLDLPGSPTTQDAPTWSPVTDVIKSSTQTTALDLPMRTNTTKVSSDLKRLVNDAIPSTLMQTITKKLSQVFSLENRAKKKKELIEKGIYKNEKVFGNYLSNIPLYTPLHKVDSFDSFDEDTEYHKTHPTQENEVPEIIVRCIRKIEESITFIGLYRINGVMSVVQKMRYNINENCYEELEDCPTVETITSTFKLFFREMLEPLITKEVIDFLTGSQTDFSKGCDKDVLIVKLKRALELLTPLSYHALHYIMQHLKRVADIKENKMDAWNLAAVFCPNLIHNDSPNAGNYSDVMSAMERDTRIVEKLIIHVEDIFEP